MQPNQLPLIRENTCSLLFLPATPSVWSLTPEGSYPCFVCCFQNYRREARGQHRRVSGAEVPGHTVKYSQCKSWLCCKSSGTDVFEEVAVSRLAGQGIRLGSGWSYKDTVVCQTRRTHSVEYSQCKPWLCSKRLKKHFLLQCNDSLMWKANRKEWVWWPDLINPRSANFCGWRLTNGPNLSSCSQKNKMKSVLLSKHWCESDSQVPTDNNS